jgi:TolB protein
MPAPGPDPWLARPSRIERHLFNPGLDHPMSHRDAPTFSVPRRAILSAAPAALLAAPAFAQAPAAPGAPSAVIDVSRARAAPIPIAITDLAGTDGASAALGRDIAQVVTADLGNSGLFRPISQAAFIQGSAGAAPNFQNWAAIGAQGLMTGTVQATGGTMRVEFRLWDVLPRTQLQGTAYTSSTANWRRIAHIIADVIYERLLGEKGYFDTRIAYIASTGPRGREVRRLAVMDQDGANPRNLTDGSWLVLTPRFAPVRDQLAFMSYANNRPRVYLFDLGTGRQTALGEFDGMTFAPRFSPDGNRVIMALSHGSGSDIVVVDVASRATQRLTHSDSIDVSPCYSPDGAQIVFNSDRGGDQQLYLMSAGGGAARRISFGSGRYGTPVWSPRGDLIAFTRFGGGSGGFEIGVMHPDGSGERILAQGWEVEGPTFAPNGRVLMFFSQTRATSNTGAGFSSHLETVDITGFNQRPIRTSTNASDPAWSPLGG